MITFVNQMKIEVLVFCFAKVWIRFMLNIWYVHTKIRWVWLPLRRLMTCLKNYVRHYQI